MEKVTTMTFYRWETQVWPSEWFSGGFPAGDFRAKVRTRFSEGQFLLPAVQVRPEPGHWASMLRHKIEIHVVFDILTN